MIDEESRRKITEKAETFCKEWPNGLPCYRVETEILFRVGAEFGFSLGEQAGIRKVVQYLRKDPMWICTNWELANQFEQELLKK